MKVSSINNNHSNIGKNVGTVAGFAGYIANVAKKEGKDVFKKAGDTVLTSKADIAVKAGSIGVVALGCALVGRLVGSFVDKLIDKHNEKNFFEITLKDAIKDVPVQKVDVLEELE